MTEQEFLEKNAGLVFNLALLLTAGRADAEDLAQDALLRAVRALPDFRGDGPASTWACRIAVDAWKNRARAAKRRLFWRAATLGLMKADEPALDAGLEARLAASAELRGTLEDLPKEPLPPDFLARFRARRARGDAPRQDWVFLPPQVRPAAAALSIGVVALMIWDKVTVPLEQPLLHPPEAAKVYGSADAPVAQLDLSRGRGGSDAKSLEIAGPAPETPRANDELAYLQDGQPADRAQAPAKPSGLPARGAAGARAAGRPIAPGAADAGSEPQLTDRTRPTMTEEERSARNEQMFIQLEKQKKKMGMKILAKEDEPDDETGRAGFLGLREPPAAPVVRASVPTLLKSAKPQGAAPVDEAPDAAAAGPGRLAPDAALVFTDASSLSSSWVLLGLPGDPPAADFANGRLVMIKPSATKILSVTSGPDAVIVVYRSLLPDEGSDPARDRVAPLPAAPKAVLIYDASPR